jgi:predicted DNA-binding transcriptional regulator YafY
MRKAARLFEIIQILRLARGPVTAAEMASRMEVTQRSLYRDIAALQAMRVPIEGERGIGYVLRPGFTLPPLNFSIEETEALVLALALLARTGDSEMKAAAARVEQKLAAALPPPLRQTLGARALHAWGTVMQPPSGIDLAQLRRAIREELKLAMTYRDAEGRESRRIIRPLALIYYSETANIVAWCEMRQDIRHFRTERVIESALTGEAFTGEGDALRQRWISGWKVPAF